MVNKIVYGFPRCGKTYCATEYALNCMEEGVVVFSNYPIIHPTLGGTLKWARDNCYDPIFNSVIIIDEAYQDYDFRNQGQGAKRIDSDEDVFFGTTGHNGITVLLIAHSPIRIDPKIRNRVEIYVRITKINVPILSRIWERFFGHELIIGFVEEQYLTEQEAINTTNPYAKGFHWFKKSVAKAYDTHYWRKDGEMKVYERWERPQLQIGVGKADGNK